MTDLTKAAQAVVSAWKSGELGLGIKEFSALEAALAAQQAPCQYCNDTGDVHGLDGEWLGTCTACKWGSAQQAEQPVVLTVDDIMGLAAAMLRAGPNYDGTISELRAAVTALVAERDQLADYSEALNARCVDETKRVGELVAEREQAAQPVVLPIGILWRGDGGAFRLNWPDDLRPIYAMPPGQHPLYAAAQPQQATGMVLTDAEIHTLAMDVELAQSDGHIERAYARAIEAAVLRKIGGAA